MEYSRSVMLSLFQHNPADSIHTIPRVLSQAPVADLLVN